MTTETVQLTTGAEAVLAALADCGVSYLFANAGTDFPPVIEALARLGPARVPCPVTVPHETAAVGMAHGYWLVTGKPQAVMVHVNVGLANAAMGVINAASDDVPVIVMSGRTPITEKGRNGSRMTPIQYGQEMYDQASIVRDVVKFTYEMRYPEQGDSLVKRAVSLAGTAPEGPVYLSLPREPLAEPLPRDFAPAPVPARPTKTLPDATAIATLAEWLAQAKNPVVLCQRGDVDGQLSRALSAFAALAGVAVCEPFSIRNVLASDDPALIGYDPGIALKHADLVVVLDSAIPWIAALHDPAADVRIAHIGPDPQFRRMPVRGYHCDLAIVADPVNAIEALARATSPSPPRHARAKPATPTPGAAGNTMSPEWVSACVSDIMDDSAVAFTELGLLPGAMRLKGANRLFSNVHAGGLGWAMPAALGAQLADRDRLVIAAMGDGSYIFANPVACHQIAEALDLPILTIIKNNAMWNAVRRSVVRGYPDGAAARLNEMPLTSLQPSPDFCGIARASRAHAERVEHGADLPAALARAVEVIRTERRQVLLDLRVAATDYF
ncbi:MAG: thiamine pyrophosphate-requiring protein [Rhodobacter sp.]|nr:thiamine pyrophosphate-requiring protein [Rhodobacter sp.]